jgi:O-acetylserine/cysteine efflux transporter
MPLRDRLLAFLVALIWGLNFTAIHVSLAQFPPFFLAAARFTLIAVPTLLLVPRPDVPWRWILGYGAGFGVLQFAFLYLAMDHGMPAGLASLVLQSSAPFTVVLAAVLLREPLSGRQGRGVALAVAGLAGIALYRAHLHGGATFLPVLLTLCGGLGWAVGNLCNRQAGSTEPFRLMLWMTVVPPLPLAAGSLALEGPHAVASSLATVGSRTGVVALGGLLFTVVVATLGGSGIWTALMSRHPSSTVAPYSMLVPVAGIGASWLLLGERTSAVELGCGAVVVAGVLLGGRRPRPARIEGRPAGEQPVRVTAMSHGAPGGLTGDRRPPLIEE